MAKYAVVVNSIFVDPNNFENIGGLSLIPSLQRDFTVFDEFDAAVSAFLKECFEFFDPRQLEFRAVSKAFQDGYIVQYTCGDKNDSETKEDIETINNIEKKLIEMYTDKKAHNVDVHHMSYIVDFSNEQYLEHYIGVTSKKVYFNIFWDELGYIQMFGGDAFRATHTNILNIDNPENEYFLEVIEAMDQKVFGGKVIYSTASVRLIPIDE